MAESTLAISKRASREGIHSKKGAETLNPLQPLRRRSVELGCVRVSPASTCQCRRLLSGKSLADTGTASSVPVRPPRQCDRSTATYSRKHHFPDGCFLTPDTHCPSPPSLSSHGPSPIAHRCSAWRRESALLSSSIPSQASVGLFPSAPCSEWPRVLRAGRRCHSKCRAQCAP